MGQSGTHCHARPREPHLVKANRGCPDVGKPREITLPCYGSCFRAAGVVVMLSALPGCGCCCFFSCMDKCPCSLVSGLS